MNGPPLAHELEDLCGSLALRPRPGGTAETRVHQRLKSAGDESVVDEEVFLDAKLVIAALEVARTIPLDAVPQRQVLRPRRRANRIGLYESQRLDRVLERRRRKQTAFDGEPAQAFEADFR